MIIDGQIGYDFSVGPLQGVSVYVQGQNLTDEPFVTQEPASSLQVTEFQRYGRRFLAGATLRF
jgi:iron complex outermembrane receptor protein